MKNWQHGFELDYLISIQDRYKEHNTYALGPFLEVKKNRIASDLHEKKLLLTEKGAISVAESKVKSPITMHGDTIIGYKQPGDITFSKITNFDKEIKDIVYANLGNNCWLFTWAEWKEANDFAIEQGFDYIGCKVSSFSEIQSVYYRDAINVLEPREHPKLLGAETINIKKIGKGIDANQINKELLLLKGIEYTNHYSNYNKKGSWSAISLRGYKDDPNFIAKPVEMNKKWKADNDGWEEWTCEDTSLRQKFPYVNELLSKLPTNRIERIRFMSLAPGGGELQRHTDQVDPDLGVNDGKIMRLHIPVVTNPKMEFTSWDMHGVKHVKNMKEGDMWYLDIRKPHMAINKGEETRIHLVVDVEASEKMRNFLEKK